MVMTHRANDRELDPTCSFSEAPRIIGPTDVARMARRYTPSLAPGETLVLLLTEQNIPVHQVCLPISQSPERRPEPREVFAAAFLNICFRIVIAHSHAARASGLIVPSAEDLDRAAQLILGGQLLNVQVIDYVLFNQDHVCSLLLQHSEQLYLYRKQLRAVRTTALTSEPCLN